MKFLIDPNEKSIAN